MGPSAARSPPSDWVFTAERATEEVPPRSLGGLVVASLFQHGFGIMRLIAGNIMGVRNIMDFDCRT